MIDSLTDYEQEKSYTCNVVKPLPRACRTVLSVRSEVVYQLQISVHIFQLDDRDMSKATSAGSHVEQAYDNG